MRILVTGATGFIGRHIAATLSDQGHDLLLTTRSARTAASARAFSGACEWKTINYVQALNPVDWAELLEDVELVINTVGIFKERGNQTFDALHDKAPRALFTACQKAGVRRVIQISALGTDHQATSAYHRSKKRADDALAGLALEWVILRPSLVIGGDGESWRFFKALSFLPRVPVIGDGKQLLQPLAIDDLTKAVVAAMTSLDAPGHRINLVGDECLTLERYLRVLAEWQGRKTIRTFQIGPVLAGHLATLGGCFTNMPLNRAAIAMLNDARRYEGEECRSKLAFMPTGVSAFLRRRAPRRDEVVAAKQYFMPPLMRLSLAFMWITAGIVSLFFYPVEQSLALLAEVGLTGTLGTIALYGASLVDILLGLALLVRSNTRNLALVQLALITFYTLALTFYVPTLWADPFGALAKNIPIMVAIMMWTTMETE